MNKVADRDIAEADFADEHGRFVIKLQGRLSSENMSDIWGRVTKVISEIKAEKVLIDCQGVSYCDGVGGAFFVDIKNRLKARNIKYEIRNLKEDFINLINLIDTKPSEKIKSNLFSFRYMIGEIGKAAAGIFEDIVEQITFLGEISAALWFMLLHPKRLRWKDFWLTVENAGANAIGIITMLGFLIGLILAFQSAIPLKRFGAEIYVADLVSISVVRELGPLITAIILAGRTGSAFAAELGTMKVNEEIDALKTMGIDPVRFLTISRLSSAIVVTPLLTLFANLFALVGCGVVMVSLGFPLTTFFDRIDSMVSMTDFFGGLAKSFVFGFLVAAVGCLRGFQTQSGATAVGNAATRAVVSGIILIIAADGIFAVVYYYLGI